MKNSNILVALAASFALFGCGGGGGNQVPANTTTTYSITNKTLADFKSVSVVDGSSGQEYQTMELDCASQATNCTFYYTGPVVNGPDTLVFKDANGVVVAGYVSGFEQLDYETVIVNPWSTGVYLYQQLNKQNAEIAAMSQDVIEAKLHTFFANYTSPDGAADYYEEIAAYYAQEMASNKPTLDEFLNGFAARLQSGEVAATSEFSQIKLASNVLQSIQMAFLDMFSDKQALIKPAYASAETCPAGIMGFLDFADAIANGVQNVFPIAGTVATATLSVSNSVCGAGEPSLTDVMNKLNAIQSSLNALRDDLRQMTVLVADTNINTSLARFRTVASEANTRGSNYGSLVNGAKTSLLAYVRQLDHPNGDGTLEYVLKKYPNGALSNLMLSVFGADGLISRIDALTDEKFNTMVASIQAKCRDIGAGDIVSTRVQCNLAVNTSMGRLLAAQTIALKVAKDVYAVADAFPDEVANQYGFSGNGADAYHALEQKFNDQLTAAKSTFESTIINSNADQKGYYNVYDGLSTTLTDNMREVTCWDNKLGVPAIGKWVKEDNGSTEYLETNCRVGSNLPSVLARYFRKIDGAAVGNEDIANVMGVLVERRYVTGQDKWYVGSRYSTGFRASGYYLKHTNIAPAKNSFAINNTNSRASNIVYPNVRGQTGPVLQYFSGNPGSVQSWKINWADNSTDVNNWMRYTDENGYSYVFYLNASPGITNLLSLYCVTGDCAIEGNSGAKYYMYFKKGPQRMSGLNGTWYVDGNRPLYPTQ